MFHFSDTSCESTMSKSYMLIVLGNGAAGAEKQALALRTRLHRHLRRLGASVVEEDGDIVRVPLRTNTIFHKLPPVLQFMGARLLRDPFFGYAPSLTDKSRLLQADGTIDRHVVIGCGRSTVSLCAALKRERDGAVFSIQIQHPRVRLDCFDAVVIPRHDLVAMEPTKLPVNVYPTHGTVCLLESERLKQEGDRWRNELGVYVEKRMVRLLWLVGGPCRGFRFSEEDARAMVDEVLAAVLRHRPLASLMVTFSRRTPPSVEKIIRERLDAELSSEELFVWDGEGRNPYEAMLHCATTIATTPDSVSMTTEALLTGKAVYTLCTDRIHGKYRHFHDGLREKNYTSLALESAIQQALSSVRACGRDAIETELERIAASLAERIIEG